MKKIVPILFNMMEKYDHNKILRAKGSWVKKIIIDEQSLYRYRFEYW